MGQPQVQRFSFAEPMAMQFQVSRYLASGFELTSHTPTSVTLVKRKQISAGALVATIILGIFSAMIPVVIYLIVYATRSDEVVELHLPPTDERQPAHPAHTAAQGIDDPLTIVDSVDLTSQGPQAVAGASIRMSPDRAMWWDGQEWQDAQRLAPPEAPRSDDGQQWWDGQQWHSLTTGASR